MFYLVKSNTQALREKITNKIISTVGVELGDVSVFDYEDTNSIEEALLEYLSTSLDGEKKVILVKNASFLNLKTVDKGLEEHFSRAIDSSVENVIIFTIDKINKTGKLNMKYADKFSILEKDAPKSNDLLQFIKTFFINNEMNIENGVAENIFNRLGEDFDLIVSELNKLEILYKDIITNEQVNKILLDFSRERLYTIANCVYEKDVQGISRMIKQLISEGESPFMVGDALNRVGSAFIRYYILRERGYSDNEISRITGWNPWFIKNYSNSFNHWSSIEELNDFYYNTIVNDAFFEFMDHQPKDALRQLEKLLISGVSMYGNK